MDERFGGSAEQFASDPLATVCGRDKESRDAKRCGERFGVAE